MADTPTPADLAEIAYAVSVIRMERTMRTGVGGWLGLFLSVALIWLVFGMLWWAPLIFAESYQALGSEFPIPTVWVVTAAARGAPLACAVLFTLVLAWLFLRPGPRRPWIIAGMATFAAVWAVVALVAMAIPIQKCGYHVPDLPWERTSSPKASGCILRD